MNQQLLILIVRRLSLQTRVHPQTILYAITRPRSYDTDDRLDRDKRPKRREDAVVDIARGLKHSDIIDRLEVTKFRLEDFSQ